MHRHGARWPARTGLADCHPSSLRRRTALSTKWALRCRQRVSASDRKCEHVAIATAVPVGVEQGRVPIREPYLEPPCLLFAPAVRYSEATREAAVDKFELSGQNCIESPLSRTRNKIQVERGVHSTNRCPRRRWSCTKTQRPVQFEITPAARDVVGKWIRTAALKSDDYLIRFAKL